MWKLYPFLLKFLATSLYISMEEWNGMWIRMEYGMENFYYGMEEIL